MRALVITVLILFLVGFVAVKAGGVFVNHNELRQRVFDRLDMVDETSVAMVREQVVADAKKLGFEVNPQHILIGYDPTQELGGIQGLVSGVAEFENRRVTIAFDYTARLFGFPLRQEINVTKIKQVRVRQRVRPDVEQMLKN